VLLLLLPGKPEIFKKLKRESKRELEEMYKSQIKSFSQWHKREGKKNESKEIYTICCRTPNTHFLVIILMLKGSKQASKPSRAEVG